ncbi:hypothetical protein Fmac_030667 [Flemingia macrophylla]|uniref:Uncharacterized protein n=1 Tax=Flemingia macrophylla TaxID=520843 RepID=A0ABD1KZV2_9FABA
MILTTDNLANQNTANATTLRSESNSEPESDHQTQINEKSNLSKKDNTLNKKGRIPPQTRLIYFSSSAQLVELTSSTPFVGMSGLNASYIQLRHQRACVRYVWANLFIASTTTNFVTTNLVSTSTVIKVSDARGQPTLVTLKNDVTMQILYLFRGDKMLYLG